MNKKNACLVSCGALLIAIVLSLIPCVFIEEMMWLDGYRDVYKLVSSASVNITYAEDIFTILFMILMGIGMVAMVLQLMEKKGKLIKLLTFTPVGASIVFAILSIQRIFERDDYGSEGHAYYIPAWGFYVICALLLITAVLSVFIALEKIKNKEE